MRFPLKVLSILACAGLLAACSAAPTAAPTVDVAPSLEAARTSAALTVEAEVASRPTATDLPATPTLAPTATEIPTSTPVPTSTTAAATKTSAPVSGSSGSSSGGSSSTANTATASVYGCTVTASLPAWGASMSGGNDFDGRWTVKNTGTKTWSASEYDYRYASGEKMHLGADSYDLPKDVAPGESVELIVDMEAPATAGGYSTNWAVSYGTITACALPVYIVVK